jgi:uncharacterized protein YndB with AHSA1/START domain
MPVSRAANTDTFTVSTPSERAIRMTRLFDAPRHLVFEVMTKPEHIRRWWGALGDGYVVTQCDVDLRPGGSWRNVMKTPQGETVGFHGVYREIAPPDRLVFTEIYDPFPDTDSLVTTVLTEENGKTRFTITAEYPSRDVRDSVLKSGMEKGAALSYDKLEEIATELNR